MYLNTKTFGKIKRKLSFFKFDNLSEIQKKLRDIDLV